MRMKRKENFALRFNVPDLLRKVFFYFLAPLFLLSIFNFELNMKLCRWIFKERKNMRREKEKLQFRDNLLEKRASNTQRGFKWQTWYFWFWVIFVADFESSSFLHFLLELIQRPYKGYEMQNFCPGICTDWKSLH